MEIEFAETIKDKKRRIVSGLTKEDAYGHEAGIPIEEWIKTNLQSIGWDLSVYRPNEFLQNVFTTVGRDERRIQNLVRTAWWGRLMVSRRQVTEFLGGKLIGGYQQAAGDLVLFYGKNLTREMDRVILLNVKSHHIRRLSRPPNIMSAQRLLEFFYNILGRDDGYQTLESVNIWFVGIYYDIVEGEGATVSDVHIRDLFKLDLSQLPQINFDAAIQIQWHVKDMKETVQDKLAFVERLSDGFIEEWREHVKAKQRKYDRLATMLKQSVTKARESSST